MSIVFYSVPHRHLLSGQELSGQLPPHVFEKLDFIKQYITIKINI